MRQVRINLTGNAIKHTPSGVVVIRAIYGRAICRQPAGSSTNRTPGHDGRPVLIKVLASTGPEALVLHQLEHELEIACELSPEFVVRPLGIEQSEGQMSLILEDCPYPPLTELLRAPLQVETFLRVAVAITAALVEIHDQGLVHKDIRPENIFSDANLASLVVSKAVNIAIEGGNSDGSCVADVSFGWIAGPHFGDYKAGFRFGQLACRLMEQRDLKRFEWQVYALFSLAARLNRHVRVDMDLLRRGIENCNRIGDLNYAGYCCNMLVTCCLVAGDLLPGMQREAESFLAFVQRIKFGLIVDIPVCPQDFR